MGKIGVTVLAASMLVVGIALGHAAGGKVAPTMYHGQAARDAGAALAKVALVQAGPDGSWERIGVGRVYYLGGMRAQGQAIFDALLAGKHADSDEFRIARVYAEAGEWAKAKPLFEDYLTRNGDEEKDLAEIGADYLVNGDRARAEQLFDRLLKVKDDEVWVTIAMAGGYLGVRPEP